MLSPRPNEEVIVTMLYSYRLYKHWGKDYIVANTQYTPAYYKKVIFILQKIFIQSKEGLECFYPFQLIIHYVLFIACFITYIFIIHFILMSIYIAPWLYIGLRGPPTLPVMCKSVACLRSWVQVRQWWQFVFESRA